MKLKLLSVIAISALLTACGSTPTIQTNPKKTTLPSIGKEITASMGEQLFVEGIGFMSDCIIPNVSHGESFNLGMAFISMKAYEPLCEISYENEFTPKYDNVASTSGSFKLPFTVKEKNNEVKFCTSLGCFNKPLGSYIKKRDFVFNESSLKQVIEFMGKSGSILEFTYSEYINNIARDAFTRTFKVDLEETNILAFKGAKVEIIDVSASQITYKVLQGFK